MTSGGLFPVVEDLALARRVLLDYEPGDEAQAGFRRQMLAFIEAHPQDAHRRSCLEGHLTASALLVDAEGERGLLTHHRKLGCWLQLGGHCDGDANLAGVAWRELTEESGVDGIVLDPTVVDLDVHVIPEFKGVPEHLHLDARFIARAPRGARIVCSEESIELSWFSPEELAGVEVDGSVKRLFDLAFLRTW